MRATPHIDEDGLVDRLYIEILGDSTVDLGAARRRVRGDVCTAAASRLVFSMVDSIALSAHGKVTRQ